MSAASQDMTGIAPPAAESAAAAGKPALDDLMLAMDIVDTLRHDMRIAERELGDDERRAALKKRLREIYSSQGIEVPDDILEDGVKALEQDRFTYKSKASGLSATLARIYVERGAWARRGALLLLLGLAVWAGWFFGFERPRLQHEAAVQAELAKGATDLDVLTRDIGALTTAPDLRRQAEVLVAEGKKAAAAADRDGVKKALQGLEAVKAEATELAALPARVAKTMASITAETQDPAVLAQLADLDARGQKAIAAFDLAAAQETASAMDALLATLRQVYDIRIVQEEGTPSGVWRIPNVNEDARNYYLIVEAVTPDGKALALPVVNEETKKAGTASRWGIRVDQTLFDAVRRDKGDDGIIQNDKVAQKKRGAAAPEWLIPAPGGAITEW